MKKRTRIAFVASLLLSMAAYSQTPEQRAWITSHYDQEALRNLKDRLTTQAAANQEQTARLAALYGWPETVTDENGETGWLVGVDPLNKPIYYVVHTSETAIATRTNYLNPGGGLNLGLEGDGMRICMWEKHLPDTSHIEFDGRVTFGESGAFVILNSHPTQVAGVMISAGYDPNAKGMASLASVTAYDFGSDDVEAMNEVWVNSLLISNHSYGPLGNKYSDVYVGDYERMSYDWDDIMSDAPYYLMVTSAGNYGQFNFNSDPMPGAGTEYDKLMGFASAKNNIVVANAYAPDLDEDGNMIAATIHDSSSPGPTDDLRIKPDIAAHGVNVYSTMMGGGYDNNIGTSFSSPNVAGTLLLLQEYSAQLNNDHVMRAATLKGLALHTADDIQPSGPDAKSGWGYLNAKKAAETMTGNGATSLINERTLDNNETYTFVVYSDGINPLSASLSWTDPAGAYTEMPPSNNPEKILVNDLNIKVSQNGTDFFPYRLTSPTTFATNGPNDADPYERVDIVGASGYYTIEVSHTGSLLAAYDSTVLKPQDYSLIVTGVIMCTPAIEITEQVGDDENDLRRSYETITAHNILDPGANAHYRAGEAVIFTDGFVASLNSTLWAQIEDCTPIEQSIGGESGRIAMPQPENNGIIQSPAAKTLTLYPNPANTTVSVKLSEGTIAQVSINTIEGKAVSTQKAEGAIYRMDISNLEKGIYVIQAKDSQGKTFHEKLIVK